MVLILLIVYLAKARSIFLKVLAFAMIIFMIVNLMLCAKNVTYHAINVLAGVMIAVFHVNLNSYK